MAKFWIDACGETLCQAVEVGIQKNVNMIISPTTLGTKMGKQLPPCPGLNNTSFTSSFV